MIFFFSWQEGKLKEITYTNIYMVIFLKYFICDISSKNYVDYAAGESVVLEVREFQILVLSLIIQFTVNSGRLNYCLFSLATMRR